MRSGSKGGQVTLIEKLTLAMHTDTDVTITGQQASVLHKLITWVEDRLEEINAEGEVAIESDGGNALKASLEEA